MFYQTLSENYPEFYNFLVKTGLNIRKYCHLFLFLFFQVKLDNNSLMMSRLNQRPHLHMEILLHGPQKEKKFGNNIDEYKLIANLVFKFSVLYA